MPRLFSWWSQTAQSLLAPTLLPSAPQHRAFPAPSTGASGFLSPASSLHPPRLPTSPSAPSIGRNPVGTSLRYWWTPNQFCPGACVSPLPLPWPRTPVTDPGLWCPQVWEAGSCMYPMGDIKAK